RIPIDGLDLRDGVELAPPPVQLQRDMTRRLEARTEAARRLAHTLRHGADLAVVASDDRDDAIRLAELPAPQDHPVIAVEAHGVPSYSTPPKRRVRAWYWRTA